MARRAGRDRTPSSLGLHNRLLPELPQDSLVPRGLRVGQASLPASAPSVNTSISNGDDDAESHSVAESETEGLRRLRNMSLETVTLESSPQSHRYNGALEARNTVYEDIANKQLPPEASELMLERLEKSADERLQRTYVGGNPMAEIHEGAVTLSVGLTFLAGADKPQVARREQTNMARKAPDQRDAVWRVNTAGALLKIFDVSSDLSTIYTDQTSTVANIARSRLQSRGTFFPEHRKSLVLSGRNYDAVTVTIDSEHVKIVDDLRVHKWDMEATLIEVDSSSLINLMVNCRHLIARGGPDMTFEETRTLLDTMIEDARRLCVRSPIIFRMSTRSVIINSTNTRYGVDHGPMFRTLTTSKGIKETISLSASYYNSLDPSGSNDQTQRLIRPRFLQMIVLLLSLLNDEDLEDIADFLESTYKLKADRRHLEMLFLKIIPLLSINPKVFLSALVPAIEGYGLKEIKDEEHGHYWDIFIQRALDFGYMLPGSINDLGRDQNSWIVKWPENGFRSTVIFKNLQYGGRLRTINEIPPIELHPEKRLSDLAVLMTNGYKYVMNPDDLEMITCLMPGKYPLREAREGGPTLDLVIYEQHINAELSDTIRRINDIIRKMNGYFAQPRRIGSVKGRFLRGTKVEFGFLKELRGSGRLTKHMATLGRDTLAIGYKVDGRKISKTDSVRNMARESQEIALLVGYIERRMNETDLRSFNGEKRELKDHLEDVKNRLAYAEQSRQRIGSSEEISDEPVAKCLYPQGGDNKQSVVWNDYEAWYTKEDGLTIRGRNHCVSRVSWLSDEVIELSLHGNPSKFFVTPLQHVEESGRDDEIQIGDFVIVAGQYLIVALPESDTHPPGMRYFMTNYLKITSMEAPNPTRRGMNRARNRETVPLENCRFV
ncbi:MAG: hypothetical protein Q9190_004176 [Brigantiaea leucoxantha]